MILFPNRENQRSETQGISESWSKSRWKWSHSMSMSASGLLTNTWMMDAYWVKEESWAGHGPRCGPGLSPMDYLL